MESILHSAVSEPRAQDKSPLGRPHSSAAWSPRSRSGIASTFAVIAASACISVCCIALTRMHGKFGPTTSSSPVNSAFKRSTRVQFLDEHAGLSGNSLAGIPKHRFMQSNISAIDSEASVASTSNSACDVLGLALTDRFWTTCIYVAALVLMCCALVAGLLPVWALLAADLLRYGLCWRAVPCEVVAAGRCIGCCRGTDGSGGPAQPSAAHARFFGTALDNADMPLEKRDRVADGLAHQWVMLSGAVAMAACQIAQSVMLLADPSLGYSQSAVVAVRLLQYPLGWLPFAAGAAMLLHGQLVRRQPVAGSGQAYSVTAPVPVVALVGLRLAFLCGVAAAATTLFPEEALFRYVAAQREDASGDRRFEPLPEAQAERFLAGGPGDVPEGVGAVVDSAMGRVPGVLLAACVGLLAVSTLWGIVGALATDVLLRDGHVRRSLCCDRLSCLACLFPWRCCCQGGGQALPATQRETVEQYFSTPTADMLLARSAVVVLFATLPALAGLDVYHAALGFEPSSPVVPFEDPIAWRMLRMALLQWVPVLFCAVAFQGSRATGAHAACDGMLFQSRLLELDLEHRVIREQTARGEQGVQNAEVEVRVSPADVAVSLSNPADAPTAECGPEDETSGHFDSQSTQEMQLRSMAQEGVLQGVLRATHQLLQPLARHTHAAVGFISRYLCGGCCCSTQSESPGSTPAVEMPEFMTWYVCFLFLVLFAAGVHESCESPLDGLSPYAVLARAPALPLQVWLPVLLALVRLSATRRVMRHNLAMGHLLPLDDVTGLHRVVAWVGLVLFSLHTLGHVLNLAYWADGPGSRPEVFARLAEQYERFFRLAAGQSVWQLAGKNVSVITGVVMLVSFVWMIALSEERLTRQRCPWVFCTVHGACCCSPDGTTAEGGGVAKRGPSGGRGRGGRGAPAMREEVTHFRFCCCCRMGAASYYRCCSTAIAYLPRLEAMREVDGMVDVLVRKLEDSAGRTDVASGQMAREIRGQQQHLQQQQHPHREAGPGLTRRGIVAGKQLLDVAPVPQGKQAADAGAQEGGNGTVEGEQSTKQRAGAPVARTTTSKETAAPAAANPAEMPPLAGKQARGDSTHSARTARRSDAGPVDDVVHAASRLTPEERQDAEQLLDPYLSRSKPETRTSIRCFRHSKRACSAVAAVAWLLHGSGGLLAAPLVARLSVGGVVVITYVVAEMLDFLLGQGGCCFPARAFTVSSLAFHASGRLRTEVDGVVSGQATTLAFHEGVRLQRAIEALRGREGGHVEARRQRLRAAARDFSSHFRDRMQFPRSKLLHEVIQARGDIEAGRAMPKRSLSVAVDTAGPAWELAQMDRLMCMQEHEAVGEIRDGMVMLGLRDAGARAQRLQDRLRRSAGHTVRHHSILLAQAREVFTELFYRRAGIEGLSCSRCPPELRTWFFTKEAVDVALGVRRQAATIRPGEYCRLGLMEPEAGGGAQGATSSSVQTTLFSETRPFTIAARRTDSDGTPSGFELHVDASGQGTLEEGESFTRYLYERLAQATVRQRQRRLRSVIEGQPVSGDIAFPMLLIHGPFPAPAVRPASGEVRFVLAFATGFGITNSLALFLNQLWLHTRRDLAAQNYVEPSADGQDSGLVAAMGAALAQGERTSIAGNQKADANPAAESKAEGKEAVAGGRAAATAGAADSGGGGGDSAQAAGGSLTIRAPHLPVSETGSAGSMSARGRRSIGPAAAQLIQHRLRHSQRMSQWGSALNVLQGTSFDPGALRRPSAPLSPLAASVPDRGRASSAAARPVVSSALVPAAPAVAPGAKGADMADSRSQAAGASPGAPGVQRTGAEDPGRTAGPFLSSRPAAQLPYDRLGVDGSTVRPFTDTDVLESLVTSGASRDTPPRTLSREGTFTSLGWVTGDLDHAFSVVAELGANVLVAACGIPRRSATEFLNRAVSLLDVHGIDAESPVFPAAHEVLEHPTFHPDVDDADSSDEEGEEEEGDGGRAQGAGAGNTQQLRGAGRAGAGVVGLERDSVASEGADALTAEDMCPTSQEARERESQQQQRRREAQTYLDRTVAGEKKRLQQQIQRSGWHAEGLEPKDRSIREATAGGAGGGGSREEDGPPTSPLGVMMSWLPRLGHGELAGFDAIVYVSTSGLRSERHVGRLVYLRRRLELLMGLGGLLGIQVKLYDRRSQPVSPMRERMGVLEEAMIASNPRASAMRREAQCIYCGGSGAVHRELEEAAAGVQGHDVRVSQEVFS